MSPSRRRPGFILNAKWNHIQICSRLLRTIMQSGFIIGPDTMQFINSTFLNPNRELIAAILTAPADCEQEALLDIVLTPSDTICRQLEPLFASACFSRDDEHRIISRLSKEPLRVPVYLGNRRLVDLELNEYSLCRYVSKLKMHRRLDDRISEVINAVVSDVDLQLRLRIKLRHSRLFFTDAAVLFISEFFEKMGESEINIEKYLGFIVEILPEIDITPRIFEVLGRRKQVLVSGIRAASLARTALEKGNPETMILTGNRMPHMDVDHAREQIIIIDALSSAMFGKTDTILPTPADVDLGEAASIDEFRKMTD